MEQTRIFSTSSTISKKPRKVSPETLYRFFRRRINRELRSRAILLDCRISAKPRGYNKLWEIELSLFHLKYSVGNVTVGFPFHGYLACHRQAGFTTYSINIDGQEFWFDKCELALASLNANVSNSYQY